MIRTIVMAALGGVLLYFSNRNYTKGNHMLFVFEFFVGLFCLAFTFLC